jgi:hypothetical protein
MLKRRFKSVLSHAQIQIEAGSWIRRESHLVNRRARFNGFAVLTWCQSIRLQLRGANGATKIDTFLTIILIRKLAKMMMKIA